LLLFNTHNNKAKITPTMSNAPNAANAAPNAAATLGSPTPTTLYDIVALAFKEGHGFEVKIP
jgi:hypothetical protein